MRTSFVLVAVSLLVGFVRAQTFVAGDFSNWTRSLFFDRASSSWRTLSADGNPPPCAEVSQTLSPVIGLTAVAVIALWDPAATWQPGLQGPIRSLTMQIDQRFDSGDPIQTQQVGVMVRQSSRTYVHMGSPVSISNSWTTVAVPAVQESDLVEIMVDGSLNTSSHPDFTSGSLTLGFAIRSAAISTPRTVTHRYDNWQLTVTPRGVFTPIAVGCDCGNGRPTIGSAGTPGLGFANFAITANGAPPFAPAMLFVGLSDTWWGAVALPFDMGPWGAPGCLLRVSPDLSVFALTDPAGSATVVFPVPAASQFVNARFCGQWFFLAPVANPLGICVTDMGLGIID